jgi:predicted carbohydrate-binding protein with CBM5 and CBM33 domain
MSRSYRKTPIYKDSMKGAKREANKAVRRAAVVPDGGGYKRIYEQWDICDWKLKYFGEDMPREFRNK